MGLMRKIASLLFAGEIPAGVYDSALGQWIFGSQTALGVTSGNMQHRAYVKSGADPIALNSVGHFCVENNELWASSDNTSYTFLQLKKLRSGSETSLAWICVRNTGTDALANTEMSFWVRGPSGVSTKSGSIETNGAWTWGSSAAPIPSLNLYANTDAGLLNIYSRNLADAQDLTASVTIRKRTATNTGSQTFVSFFVNTLQSSGKIVAAGADAAAFASTSDVRLKENVEDLPPQLEKILSLRPVEFDYKNGSGHQIGFIAQEVETVYPEFVHADDSEEKYLSLVGLGRMEAIVFKAIQELAAQNQQLQTRLAALEAK